ncbi:hypothetical protein SAMN03080617_01571 [Algoriphagus alkaliphilus]|uniref:Uncharacterized protein n=1 Tax=Algoriphagus alkaliphilus TaxID=279824 RepID=A0A1G5X789_9BACT|nr:hypothetical protein SAMN03080617_01571 [Algoriphagus alkaliphilus]
MPNFFCVLRPYQIPKKGFSTWISSLLFSIFRISPLAFTFLKQKKQPILSKNPDYPTTNDYNRIQTTSYRLFFSPLPNFGPSVIL